MYIDPSVPQDVAKTLLSPHWPPPPLSAPVLLGEIFHNTIICFLWGTVRTAGFSAISKCKQQRRLHLLAILCWGNNEGKNKSKVLSVYNWRRERKWEILKMNELLRQFLLEKWKRKERQKMSLSMLEADIRPHERPLTESQEKEINKITKSSKYVSG